MRKLCSNLFYLSITLARLGQGFQSGPVPGTFTRLRSCMVPAEITEPPKISGGQNHKYDRLVEYFSPFNKTKKNNSDSLCAFNLNGTSMILLFNIWSCINFRGHVYMC